MILRIPDYYRQFRCLMGDCKDSCCKGWEIDIDDETYAYYKVVEGDFGDRIRKAMRKGEEHSFFLNEGRCPFLNWQNLCDICIELGEESLSEVCTEYPRFTVEYGQVKEKSLALSCEEVGRLIFSRKDKLKLEEIREDGYPENTEEEPFFPEEIEQIRDLAIKILQNRLEKIEYRAIKYLMFCEKAQLLIEKEHMESDILKNELEKICIDNVAEEEKELQYQEEAILDLLHTRVDILRGMELLEEKWEEKSGLLQKLSEIQGYLPDMKQFLEQFRSREYEYEHLLVYYTFRYFTKAVYDRDVLNKAKLAVLGYLAIRDLDLISWKEHQCSGQEECISLEEQIDVVKIFAREVEHAEENLEYLAKELKENPAFGTGNLTIQIL